MVETQLEWINYRKAEEIDPSSQLQTIAHCSHCGAGAVLSFVNHCPATRKQNKKPEPPKIQVRGRRSFLTIRLDIQRLCDDTSHNVFIHDWRSCWYSILNKGKGVLDLNSQLVEIWNFKSLTCVQLTSQGLLVNSLATTITIIVNDHLKNMIMIIVASEWWWNGRGTHSIWHFL